MVDQAGWSSREKREAVEMAAQAIFADGRVIPVVLTNFSNGGCEVHSGETLGIGAKLVLNTVGGGQVDASVRWALMGKAGLRFVPEQL